MFEENSDFLKINFCSKFWTLILGKSLIIAVIQGVTFKNCQKEMALELAKTAHF